MTQAPRSGSGRNSPRDNPAGNTFGRNSLARSRSRGAPSGGTPDGTGGRSGTGGRDGSPRAGAGRGGTGSRDDQRAGFKRDDGGFAPADGRPADGPRTRATGRPSRPATGRPAPGKSSTGKAGRPAAGRPSAGRPSTGNPASGKSSTGKGGTPAGDKKPANRQKPAGPRPFGRERFGQSMGPVRRPKPARATRPADEVDVHNPDGVRLQKVMASAGVASRRVCEDMIAEGRVEVDGTVVTELGVRVDPATAAIHVDGIRLQLNENLMYYVFNKPKGVISTMEDPEGRPCVSDFLKNKNKTERLFHVGRLDVETEGLLLLTNDGELTNRLTHPSFEVPKTYLVQVRGPMAHGIGAQMREGIELEDGLAKVDSFRLVDSTPGHILVEVVLHTGRNRVVRRMFDAIGHPVERLVRTQVGPIRINDQRQGSIRVLGRQEVGHLLATVGL